jgi:hypothetical protein
MRGRRTDLEDGVLDVAVHDVEALVRLVGCVAEAVHVGLQGPRGLLAAAPKGGPDPHIAQPRGAPCHSTHERSVAAALLDERDTKLAECISRSRAGH